MPGRGCDYVCLSDVDCLVYGGGSCDARGRCVVARDGGTETLGDGGPAAVWTCDPTLAADGICTCGCGAPDPDCAPGEGCTTDGCRSAGCERCVRGGALEHCFDFCGPCTTDADCPLGVCVPDPDGPGTGFCTASCDVVDRCGELCGDDGNCLTARLPAACAEDRTHGGATDGCGNFLDANHCGPGQHCELQIEGNASTGGSFAYAVCAPNYRDGTPSIEPRLCASGMLGSYPEEPSRTFCTSSCASSACGDGLHCTPTAICAPDLFTYCDPTGTVRYARDGFGVEYPALAMPCPAGTRCRDPMSLDGQAVCQTLRGDGQDCTTSSQCDGGVCRTVPDATSIFFCSRPCGDDSACVWSMTCSAEGTCVPRRREVCSPDDRRRVSVDSFGRTYGTIETCPLDKRCTASGGRASCDQDRCDRPSGCSCYGGFCTCCSPEDYAPDTDACCRICDSESECRSAP